MIFSIISWPLYQSLLFIWIGVALVVFFILMFITAPYGRHSSTKWGPMIGNKAGWVIMEMPVLIVLFMLVIPAIEWIPDPAFVMLGLFCLHYFNRVFIFPFRLHTSGKKMPLLIVASAVLFNLINGFSIGYYFMHYGNYDLLWFKDLRFITGLVLFFAGMLINWKSDHILIHLRKPGETHYMIPKKWLFDFISCPNLFGELMEWFGFAILCWNLPALSFFIWTAANLIPRAIAHHRWYREKFPAYPPQRKAIIPFVL